MINRDRLINSFLDMVRIDSVSRQERAFMEYLQAEFGKRGFRPGLMMLAPIWDQMPVICFYSEIRPKPQHPYCFRRTWIR